LGADPAILHSADTRRNHQSRPQLPRSEWLHLDGPPILTPAACEGTTTLFPVEYFGDEAYLTQSGQLYLESTAMALGKVYSFGPTFRAEKSKTRRHLTDLDGGTGNAFADLTDLMRLAEDFIAFIVGQVIENRSGDLQTIGRDLGKLQVVKAPFPRIKYDEAVEILREGYAKGELEQEFEWGNDFGSPDETFLSSHFERPVIVHRYPSR